MEQPEIAGYTILKKIADGGMSTVWKARQESLDRVVALKVLNSGLVKSRKDIERFKSEAQAAARLRHSGLCQIFDAGEQEGIVYYAMEYVAGFSVWELLERKGDINEKQALLIVSGVANVLGAMWNKHQLIHCDIKPDNILIDQDGVIRVTDLGLSRLIGQMMRQEDDGYLVGTPNYMSPEQARGDADLDFRTDIYALGATLYHLLTGIMPFAQKDSEKAAEAHVVEYLSDPRDINPEVSMHACFLIEKMMVRDRAHRYASWEDLSNDIAEVRAGRPPRGALVPEGHSTVSRSAEREAETAKEIASMKPRKLASSVAAPAVGGGNASGPGSRHGRSATGRKKRLVGRAPGATAPRLAPRVAPAPRSAAPVDPWTHAARKTFWLILLVGGSYWGAFHFLGGASPVASSAESVEAETPVAEPEVAAPPVATPRPPPPERPPRRPPPAAIQEPVQERETPVSVPSQAPGSARPATTEAWDHPDYVEAMRLLREADARFQRFVAERRQEFLDPVEPNCRRALELLEAIKDEAPAHAQVGAQIRNASQLIFNARQSRVLSQ
jgi:serine/threonine protein kinase